MEVNQLLSVLQAHDTKLSLQLILFFFATNLTNLFMNMNKFKRKQIEVVSVNVEHAWMCWRSGKPMEGS